MLLKKQTVNNRHFIRDLLVYTVTSVRYLLLKGELQLFIKDMQSFIQWRKYRTSGKGTIDFQVPWLVFSSISFIDRWLQSGFNFSAYVKAIEAYTDASFDLVIVDGRVRHSCITHAISKVKKVGLLLVDNADRNYYLQPHPVLFDERKWKWIRFAGHFPFGVAFVLNEKWFS